MRLRFRVLVTVGGVALMATCAWSIEWLGWLAIAGILAGGLTALLADSPPSSNSTGR